MLTDRGNTGSSDLSTEKDRLSREADEALSKGDDARCIDAINRLYDLLDDTWTIRRRGHSGSSRRVRV